MWVLANEMPSPFWIPAAMAQGGYTWCLSFPSSRDDLPKEFCEWIILS